MPIHPDFKKIYDNFVNQYGQDGGKSIYYAWLYNEQLDDTKSLKSQKSYSVDSWHLGEFSKEHYDNYPELIDKINVFPIGNSKEYIYKIKNDVRDAIPPHTKEIQKVLNDFFLSEKEKYSLIIDKWTARFYDEGIQTAAEELSMEVAEFGNIKSKMEQVKILQTNSKNLLFNMFDDVNKEIGLFTTNIALNKVLISNTELKKEIQQIFMNKQSRLQSQITSETTRSFNTALEFGYKESGLVTHKQWVSVIDDKTTSICQALNGEIVEIGKPFSSGDYAPPAHINCRSRIVSLTLS